MTSLFGTQNLTISLVAPFFPLAATDKGVSESLVGVIISFCPIFYIISSLVMGKYQRSVGRKLALNLGLCMICVQLLVLGLLDYVESPKLFITLAMLAQALGGIGDGTISTTCLSLITSCYPEDK